MSSSPVLELQALASSNISDGQEVLLKAKMISVKLGLNDITEWLESEANGYYCPRNLIPSYRVIKNVQVNASSSFHGWIPVKLSHLEDPEIYEILTTLHLTDSISSLQEYSKKNCPLYFSMPKPIADHMYKRMDSRVGQIAWVISSTEANRIISTVKSKVLDWSLSLEQKGIIGEGLLFSKKEKEVAHMTINNTTNIHGNVNNTGIISSGNSDISQENIVTIGDFSSLEKKMKEFGVSEEDIINLKQAIDHSPNHIASKDNLGEKIGKWIGEMVGKAYSGSLKVVSSSAPLLLTNAICAYYGIPV